jgi:hypothetical protein
MLKNILLTLLLFSLLFTPVVAAQEATETPPVVESVVTDAPAPVETDAPVETEAPVITDAPTELSTELPPATDIPVVTDASTELPVATEAPIEAAPTEAPAEPTEAPAETTRVPTDNRVIVTPEVATDVPDAAAATFVVNTTADIATPASGDGICDSDIGAPIVCTPRCCCLQKFTFFVLHPNSNPLS